MTYKFVVAAISVALWSAGVSEAQVVVTPNTSPPPLQNVQAFTIDASTGSHFDPHVDGTLISYTSNADDGTGAHIRYFRLGVDTVPQGIPFPASTQDFLSRVSGTRIAYSHVDNSGVNINLFDTAQPVSSANPIPINFEPGAERFFATPRGNLIAYIDQDPAIDPQGGLVIYDLLANTATQVTNDAATNSQPSFSPDGGLIVWQKCPIDTNHCDIWKAVNTGGTWIPSVVSDDPGQEAFAGTNGAVIVYSADRADGTRVFYRDAANVEYEVQMPSTAAGPRISGDFIVFQSQTVSGRYNIFLFQLSTARLWNLSNQSVVDDLLSDISVLPDGEVVIAYE